MIKKIKKMFEKKYYIPGVDVINQLVETPLSKEKTEFRRFVITLVISMVSAIAAIVAATVAVMTYLKV